jgi:hypothetical protein
LVEPRLGVVIEPCIDKDALKFQKRDFTFSLQDRFGEYFNTQVKGEGPLTTTKG